MSEPTSIPINNTLSVSVGNKPGVQIYRLNSHSGVSRTRYGVRRFRGSDGLSWRSAEGARSAPGRLAPGVFTYPAPRRRRRGPDLPSGLQNESDTTGIVRGNRRFHGEKERATADRRGENQGEGPSYPVPGPSHWIQEPASSMRNAIGFR